MLRAAPKRLNVIPESHPYFGKKIWIPRMPHGGARLLAAAFHSIGIDADCTPASDERTRELGAKHTCGDECYPTKVTLGDFLKLLEQPGTDPRRTVLFMPTAGGPCRFGQYAPYFRAVLASLGYGEVEVLSPNGDDGYRGLGEVQGVFFRTSWRAIVTGDLLLKMLLKTRPYEVERGAADRAYEDSLVDLGAVIGRPYSDAPAQLRAIVVGVARARDRFRAVPARYHRALPLIGIVGEIFCRLNTFSNDEVVRRLEEYGAECWMSDISEWIWYSNSEHLRKLRLDGRSWSLTMLGARLRQKFQKHDEEALWAPALEDFCGYEEPHEISEVLDYARPYLLPEGAMGEMVVNVGRSVYLARQGADGVVDISPFTCMNGIVCEAIYPRVSRDNAEIPIRNFYFDGTQSDLDRDIGIFLELARTYSERKPHRRVYPWYFPPAGQPANR